MSAAAPWKLYGVPLSQPFRSVAWALLQNQIRFDAQVVVPGAASKVGSRNEAFQNLSRMKGTKVPLLEDTRTGFTVAESPAILAYLCDYHGWHSLYAPPGSTKRATIDSYMHWHHTGTRKLSSAVFPYLRPSEGNNTMDQEKSLQKVAETLKSLEEGWFSTLDNGGDKGDCFLAGGDHPTIADLLAYEEIIQLPMMGVVQDDFLQTEFPKIHAWTRRMAQLPFHEEVHVSLTVLGNVVTANDDVPLIKRLGAANKAALKALADAQANFPSPTSADAQPSSKL